VEGRRLKLPLTRHEFHHYDGLQVANSERLFGILYLYCGGKKQTYTDIANVDKCSDGPDKV
jgi:hypothetical protein